MNKSIMWMVVCLYIFLYKEEKNFNRHKHTKYMKKKKTLKTIKIQFNSAYQEKTHFIVVTNKFSSHYNKLF